MGPLRRTALGPIVLPSSVRSLLVVRPGAPSSFLCPALVATASTMPFLGASVRASHTRYCGETKVKRTLRGFIGRRSVYLFYQHFCSLQDSPASRTIGFLDLTPIPLAKPVPKRSTRVLPFTGSQMNESYFHFSSIVSSFQEKPQV